MSRIQINNRKAILSAALDVFAAQGFRGATLDAIAAGASLSKTNLLYYFSSKEAIHRVLLDGLIGDWLAPLEMISEQGEPIDEILAYLMHKLTMSRTHAKQSRLFVNAIGAGGSGITALLNGDLKAIVDRKAALIQKWMNAGRLAPSDPHHLIFSIWALTQHYADFSTQITAVLGPEREPITESRAFCETLYRRLLTP